MPAPAPGAGSKRAPCSAAAPARAAVRGQLKPTPECALLRPNQTVCVLLALFPQRPFLGTGARYDLFVKSHEPNPSRVRDFALRGPQRRPLLHIPSCALALGNLAWSLVLFEGGPEPPLREMKARRELRPGSQRLLPCPRQLLSSGWFFVSPRRPQARPVARPHPGVPPRGSSIIPSNRSRSSLLAPPPTRTRHEREPLLHRAGRPAPRTQIALEHEPRSARQKLVAARRKRRSGRSMQPRHPRQRPGPRPNGIPQPAHSCCRSAFFLQPPLPLWPPPRSTREYQLPFV